MTRKILAALLCLCAALPLLARLALTSAQPQDFRLWPAEDGWRMESRDLDEEIAGENGPLF